MTVKTEKLIYQIRQAQKLGQSILSLAGLTDLNMVYAFATDTTLVVNCRDYGSLWQLDDAQIQLRHAITLAGLKISTIWIEKNGQLAYEF
ncbi:hypothetical protein [Nodosilinea sp. P-1105]|uniref:hypothetical protein n=1 Tax=Nodosilinea sp. P-1105 TaxID=2546229 RepID=UPI00146DF4CC|nr:hypothetical protein [Nodosilinea sp. P-1105]NMF84262.1 hypothetical protein [Nodosilinea sp. P-1105]